MFGSLSRILLYENLVFVAISLLVAVLILYVYDKHIIKLPKFQYILIADLILLAYIMFSNKRPNFYNV